MNTPQKLTKTITINAPKEKVWSVLLDDATYRIWTKAFAEGSHAETDWQEGSRILFKDGQGLGLVSRVAEHKPNERIVIEHLGILSNGKEDLESDEVKKWQGAQEIYSVTEDNGVTTLLIEQDISDEDGEMFSAMWDKALQNVKELAES